MTATLITAATALMLALVVRRQGQKPTVKTRRAVAPTVARAHNPRAMGQGLWQVRPCKPGCKHTQLLVGRVLPASETIALPPNDPDRPGCSCCYIAVNNQRRGQRRGGNERRDCFRMANRERRGAVERRAQMRVWLNSLR